MKKLGSFISECFVFMFVVMTLFFILVYNKILMFSSPVWFIVTMAGIVIIAFYSSEIVNIGTKAMIDLLFKQSIIRKGVITDIVPFERSTFSEKWDKERIRKKEPGFYVSFFVNGTPLTLISTSSLLLEKDKEIKIRFGRFSHVILEII